MKTLLAKELREGWRTWRLPLLVAVLAISGLISPVLAYYTPALLRLMPDMPIDFASLIPEPTAMDALAQYVKNVSQFGVLLVVILTMGTIAQEKERGTAAMLLARPVQRSAFVLAKWVVWAVGLAAGLLIAALLCVAYTALLFEPLRFGEFLLLNLLMWAFLATYLSVALLASALARTQAAAAGLAFGGLALLLILSALPRIGDFMPGRLPGWGVSLMLEQPAPAWLALGIALGIMAVSLIVACLRLAREEF